MENLDININNNCRLFITYSENLDININKNENFSNINKLFIINYINLIKLYNFNQKNEENQLYYLYKKYLILYSWKRKIILY